MPPVGGVGGSFGRKPFFGTGVDASVCTPCEVPSGVAVAAVGLRVAGRWAIGGSGRAPVIGLLAIEANAGCSGAFRGVSDRK
ncbi:MAG: hypothetical protein EPO65_13815, partial [Dehalococcoidia bacterium]